MALGTVQAGYGNSLCAYSVFFKGESDISYADLLAELTTELELAGKSGDEEPVLEDSGEDSETSGPHLDRKKEWEELLEQSISLEAMLRQMLENGLGQQKEEQQKPPKKQEKEELDNEFQMNGIPMNMEGKSRSESEDFEPAGTSKSLQTNTGHGAEYFSLANGDRQYCERSHAICLTCETECEKKKQWKITE